MGAFISLFFPFSSLAWWKEGLGGRRGEPSCAVEGGNKAHAVSGGDELPEPFTWGGDGVSLAWLLPISFTSGWATALASLLESLAPRWLEKPLWAVRATSV